MGVGECGGGCHITVRPTIRAEDFHGDSRRGRVGVSEWGGDVCSIIISQL